MGELFRMVTRRVGRISDYVVACAAAAVLFLSCQSQPPAQGPKPSMAEGEDASRVFRGRASWYGGKFHGRKTANGERYDQNKLTCAHRTLPFGTMVRVVNVETHQAVIVRVNDRGPFGGKGRIIDLSKAAAAELGMLERGVINVRVEVLSIPP